MYGKSVKNQSNGTENCKLCKGTIDEKNSSSDGSRVFPDKPFIFGICFFIKMQKNQIKNLTLL